MVPAFPLRTNEHSNGHPVRRRALCIILDAMPYILTVATICYLYIGLSDGQMFNEDYAVYLQQAWNISHHIPMRDMGVVQYFDPNLTLMQYSPLTYPPLLPLIYAVPVVVFGFNLFIFKAIQLLMLLAGLLVFCYAMSKWRFNTMEISSSILIFTLCPYTRAMANNMTSDLPFILFLVVALFSVDGFVRSMRLKRYRWGIFSGVSIFLAINVRTVGVALLPTLLLADFLVHRRIRFRSLAIPAVIVAALWIGEWALGFSGESYGVVLHYPFFALNEHIHRFYWALARPFTGAAFPNVGIGIFLIFAELAAIGLLYEAANGMIIAVFIVIYTALLLFLPDFDAGPRYLLPHLLVLGAFAVRGAAVIGSLIHTGVLGRQVVTWGTAALGLVWLFAAPFQSTPRNFGVTETPAREIFAFIRERTSTDALVATSRYRSFHLFTQRTTIRAPAFHTMRDMLAWLRSHRVTEVVVKYSLPRSGYDVTDCPESPLCRTDNPDPDIKEVFRNSDFALFHVSFGKD